MSYLARIRTRNREGILERVLGVVRVRGFDIQSVAMQPTPGGDHFDITLDVRSRRTVQVLSRQLDRLQDVEHVDVYGKIDARPNAQIGTA